VADFDLGTQQNMELRMAFHLKLKSTMNRGLKLQKCSALFICAHNKGSGVLALCWSNPKLSAPL
jgi:hypothetical protein